MIMGAVSANYENDQLKSLSSEFDSHFGIVDDMIPVLRVLSFVNICYLYYLYYISVVH